MKKTEKKRFHIRKINSVYAVSAAIVLFGLVILKALDRRLQIARRTIKSKTLPDGLNGVKIVHLSDLHGVCLKGLMEIIQSEHPDLILCTGDMYDAWQGHPYTRGFLLEISRIAPVYCAEGNHECFWKQWPREKAYLQQQGIQFPEKVPAVFSFNGESLEITALPNPEMGSDASVSQLRKTTRENCLHLPEKRAWRIVLFHRGNLYQSALAANPDLLLCGHLHGGHWRFFGRGFISPAQQGKYQYFPAFTSGQKTIRETVISISRGLADHMAVPRLFNRPEICVLTLEKTEDGLPES